MMYRKNAIAGVKNILLFKIDYLMLRLTLNVFLLRKTKR